MIASLNTSSENFGCARSVGHRKGPTNVCQSSPTHHSQSPGSAPSSTGADTNRCAFASNDTSSLAPPTTKRTTASAYTLQKDRSEEHTSAFQSLMRIAYAALC